MLDKNWILEKKDLRKVANEFFISYAKVFLIVLPILLILSIFFILVGVLDDEEALDYGIPCIILFIVISFYLLNFYFIQHFKINKQCAQSQFVLRQQDEKFLYKINDEKFKLLEVYKIYILKNYYFIIDLNSKNIIIIPKYLEDLENIINQLKICATTKIILNKTQFIYIGIVILVFVIISILSIKTTTTYYDLESIKYIQNDEMIEKLYPKELLEDFTYTEGDFYYFNEDYKFLPSKKPEVAILSFAYSPEEYIELLQQIPTSNEFFYMMNDYVFYFYGANENFPKEFYMIVLNEKKKCIIFLGYKDFTNKYKNLIQNDFSQFIKKTYGKIYDFS